MKWPQKSYLKDLLNAVFYYILPRYMEVIRGVGIPWVPDMVLPVPTVQQHPHLFLVIGTNHSSQYTFLLYLLVQWDE